MPNRRTLITSLLALTGLGAMSAFFHKLLKSPEPASPASGGDPMILQRFPLDFQWPVREPFLFCVHHHDFYPPGTSSYGPEQSLLSGRPLGQDFEARDGFRMYHGQTVPGFPVHPHRGFETITVVRKGYVDHADSLGAAGRYGEGDVQWMTAGQGVQHSEMFPLLKSGDKNTLELFQIWLNLPKKSKMSPAHFKMFWSEQIPQLSMDGGKVNVNLIAGELEGRKSLAPPPDSWAADPAHEVCVLLVKISAGGSLKIPKSKTLTNRSLYFFEGSEILLNNEAIPGHTGLFLDSQIDLELKSPHGPAEVLLLQAQSINEPVFQHGPFVMNTRDEIIQTIHDYQRTEFGGWPWERPDMIHGAKIERFAKYPDGRIEKPG